LEGFKRFRSNNFALRPLTVLAGMNGTGKTSVIHALLFAREASRQKLGIVELNGPYGLELGTFEDVANYEAGDHFEIALTDGAPSVPTMVRHVPAGSLALRA
jgi:hypothetical protein